MSRNGYRHPTLGEFEWEPNVDAWVRGVEVVLAGRREEVTLELSGYRRRKVASDQARLAERLVRGLLTERWPEVRRRSAAHGGSEWELDANRDRTRIQVDDGQRWHVEVHLNEDADPEFDDGDDTSLRFDFTEPWSAVAPLTTSVTALAALEQVLAAAAAGHELDGPLEAFAYHVSVRYTPPQPALPPPAPPRVSPRVEGARRLLADWQLRGRVEFDDGANLDAVAAWFLAAVDGRRNPRIGDWLVGLDEVVEVYATDEELMADLAGAPTAPVAPPQPAAVPATREPVPDADPDGLARLLAPLDPALTDGIRRALEVTDDGELDLAFDDLAALLGTPRASAGQRP